MIFLSFINLPSWRRSRHLIGFHYFTFGIPGGLPPFPFLFSCLACYILNMHWRFNHDALMHAFVISYVRTVLRVLSKYSPGLLIWPDADEGDLMDEEFDSESDA